MRRTTGAWDTASVSVRGSGFESWRVLKNKKGVLLCMYVLFSRSGRGETLSQQEWMKTDEQCGNAVPYASLVHADQCAREEEEGRPLGPWLIVQRAEKK